MLKTFPGWAFTRDDEQHVEYFLFDLIQYLQQETDVFLVSDTPHEKQYRSVLRNVVNLECGRRQTVVLRKTTEDFWKACMKKETPNMRYRVCAVGTPGTGKTTLTPILIRLLLKAGRTVVYHVRTQDKEGWF